MVDFVNPVQLNDGEVFGVLSNGFVFQDTLYRGYVVRGMTGYEEDLLSDQNMNELEKLNRIIGGV